MSEGGHECIKNGHEKSKSDKNEGLKVNKVCVRGRY
jgi:hypothetical protein